MNAALTADAEFSAGGQGVVLDVEEARSVLMKLVVTTGGGTGNSKSSMREDIIRRRIEKAAIAARLAGRPLAILRMQQLFPRLEVIFELMLGVSQHALPARRSWDPAP